MVRLGRHGLRRQNEAAPALLARSKRKPKKMKNLCPVESGGERAALQTLREDRDRLAVALAFGVRWL